MDRFIEMCLPEFFFRDINFSLNYTYFRSYTLYPSFYLVTSKSINKSYKSFLIFFTFFFFDFGKTFSKSSRWRFINICANRNHWTLCCDFRSTLKKSQILNSTFEQSNSNNQSFMLYQVLSLENWFLIG